MGVGRACGGVRVWTDSGSGERVGVVGLLALAHGEAPGELAERVRVRATHEVVVADIVALHEGDDGTAAAESTTSTREQ